MKRLIAATALALLAAAGVAAPAFATGHGNGGYDEGGHGRPNPVVTTTTSDDVVCDAEAGGGTVTTTTTTTTTPWVRKDHKWVKGTPVVTTTTDTRPAAVPIECPPLIPAKPDAIVETASSVRIDCDIRKVITTTTTTTTDWHYSNEEWTWVKGEPVTTTTVDTRRATRKECKPNIPSPTETFTPLPTETVTPTPTDTDTVTPTPTQTATTSPKPSSTATIVPVASNTALPRTGPSDSTIFAGIAGLALLAGGSSLVLVSRRKR